MFLMLRLNLWNLTILILTFLTAVVHVIHLSLLNHLNFVQQQSKKAAGVTFPHFTSPDEEAKSLFYTLELALKQDEALDSSGSYKVSSRLTRMWRDSTSPVPSPDLTLVTYTSYINLYKIVTAVHYWQGPVSVAVFANNNEMAEALWSISTLMACHPSIKSSVSFSVVSPVSAHSSPPLAPPGQPPFRPCSLDAIENDGPIFLPSYKLPVNILRNAARRAASSEFVLVVDIDVLPSENLRQDFLLFAAQHGLYKRQNPYHKSVFVIPTFETREDSEIPLHKAHLLSFIETGEARPYFSEICKKCQERTNYEGWLKDPVGSEMTPFTTVLWKDPWEPFYIVRNNAPFYDERFKQYGFNRISQMCELHVSGYSFSVMKKAFLVNRGFKTLESFNLETESDHKNDVMLYRQFKAELKVQLSKHELA